MKRIGRLKHFFFLLLLTFGFSGLTVAQDIQVDAELSETNIFNGEQVRLEVSVSGNAMGSVRQPELPEIEGLRWLRGSTSRGTQYTIINGKPSVTYTYGYVLIAQSPGDYTLPPITITVEDKTYQTDPIPFTVLDPASLESGDAERAPDIYIRVEPDTKDPVVGQQVVADVVLYFKNGVEVSSYQPTPGWKAEGFWKEELNYPQRAQTSSTIVNGVRYQKARLIQYALFPTKSGELTLSPFEITVSVRSRRSSADPFGFGLNQERMTLQSTPVTLNVEGLPELNNAEFIGAVGDFEITRTISTSSALVGESIEINTQVSGKGNIPLVNKPDYELPESLERYNPEESSNIERNDREITGSRNFRDIVIPRNEGDYTIPATKVAYYDPSRSDFVIVTLPELTFRAERDPDAPLLTEKDLRFNVKPITGLASWSKPEVKPLHERVLVWMMIIFPILLTAGAYGFKKYHDRMQTDSAFSRSRRATDKANSTLEEADQTNDIKAGYHLIDKALTQFITDKLNLPPAGLSHDQLMEAVEKFNDRELNDRLRKILNKCKTIAYAPNATQESLTADIEITREIIKKIGKLS